MRDEDFEYFISKFGEATHKVEVPATSIDRWCGKLPDQMLTYWQQEGWCGYANGLFWTVNPDDFEDIVDEWLEGTPLERLDAFHVVARSSFGKLYLCGEASGQSVVVNCATNAIFSLKKELAKKSKDDLDWSIRGFIGLSRNECDLNDEAHLPLFDRVVKKLGPLAPDEMYGFEPALVVGGKMRLENLRRVKLDQHLTILRQLAAPTIPFADIDVEKLLSS